MLVIAVIVIDIMLSYFYLLSEVFASLLVHREVGFLNAQQTCLQGHQAGAESRPGCHLLRVPHCGGEETGAEDSSEDGIGGHTAIPSL